MEPNLNALSVIRSDRPGQQFEMVVWRYANKNATVRVDRLGMLRRNVANRDVNKERPRWGDSGDVIQFAGDVWVPVDHDAAVAWMGAIDAFLEASPVRSSEPATAAGGSARAGLPNPTAQLKETAERAESVARFVETVMWVILALSILGGLILALQGDQNCDFFARCSFWEEYPLLGLGVGLAIGGVIQCSMVIMVATYIRARADGSIK